MILNASLKMIFISKKNPTPEEDFFAAVVWMKGREEWIRKIPFSKSRDETERGKKRKNKEEPRCSHNL